MRRIRQKENNKDPKLCDFNCIHLSVPKARLISLFWKRDFLTSDEIIFLKGLQWKAESIANKAAHIQSVVNRALIKAK